MQAHLFKDDARTITRIATHLDARPPGCEACPARMKVGPADLHKFAAGRLAFQAFRDRALGHTGRGESTPE